MLKTLTIVTAATIAAASLPIVASAQTDTMTGRSMSNGSMGMMKSKSMMMKKHKMKHHSMHHGMMKKPMSSGGGM